MSATEPTPSASVDQPFTVVNNEAAHRFEIHAADGTLAELVYHVRSGDTMVLVHTEVPPALRGHGAAGALARAALDDARARGFRVVVKCPYVRAFIERHPEYKDMVNA
jgi:predicted GNAT family acetyltransferase